MHIQHQLPATTSKVSVGWSSVSRQAIEGCQCNSLPFAVLPGSPNRKHSEPDTLNNPKCPLHNCQSSCYDCILYLNNPTILLYHITIISYYILYYIIELKESLGSGVPMAFGSPAGLWGDSRDTREGLEGEPGFRRSLRVTIVGIYRGSFKGSIGAPLRDL